METLDQLCLTKILVGLYPRDVIKMLFLNKHFYNRIHQKHIFRLLIDAHYPGHIYTDNPIQQYLNIYKKIKVHYQISDNKAIKISEIKEECSLDAYMRDVYYRREKENTLHANKIISEYPISTISFYGSPIIDMVNAVVLVKYIYSDKETKTLIFKDKDELMKYIKTSSSFLCYERMIELIKEYTYNYLDYSHRQKIENLRKRKESALEAETLYTERLNTFDNSSLEDMLLLPEFIEQLLVCGLPENLFPLTSERWYNFVNTNQFFYLDRNGDHYFYFIKTLSF